MGPVEKGLRSHQIQVLELFRFARDLVVHLLYSWVDLLDLLLEVRCLLRFEADLQLYVRYFRVKLSLDVWSLLVLLLFFADD